MQPHHNHKNTSWDQVATWYDQLVGERGSEYHENVIIPGALRMIDAKKGEKILDLGCGQGIFPRELASKGAEITGIDNSGKLIKAAKERSKKFPNIKYFVGHAAHLDAFSDQSFDAVSCIMAIQNMEPLDRIIKGISRVLKTNGRFLLVTAHPAFRIPRQSGWGFDEKRKLQYRRVDTYMSEMKIPIQMHPGFAPDVITWTIHRPLSSYFKELNANHLAVTQFEEWVSHRESQPGGRSRTENRSRKEFPLFLGMVAKKIINC
ncbi:MAG: class I SAM-dependent methyltransferase [Candidatus Saganbacteria bacterium]|nr:class I SAM-dependent methyltransferase [Candidatus Saganbacteria bacterium]